MGDVVGGVVVWWVMGEVMMGAHGRAGEPVPSAEESPAVRRLGGGSTTTQVES